MSFLTFLILWPVVALVLGPVVGCMLKDKLRDYPFNQAMFTPGDDLKAFKGSYEGDE